MKTAQINSAFRIIAQGALVLLFMLASGCSSGKVLVARNSDIGLSRVAIVLSKSPVGARPDRVARVTEAVEQALHTKGFAVLSADRVEAVCGENAQGCSSADLIQRYDLDAVGKLEISSVSTNNFLVGYVASISGTLSFENSQGAVIEQVSHRELENSGVLGNSGQVLGAISSQADAFSGDTFAALANAFGRKIVDRLSVPHDRATVIVAPEIQDVKVTKSEGLVHLCVMGTPGAAVSAEGAKGGKYSLVEVEKGMYCGAYRFFPMGMVTVRLNNFFGAGQQRMVTPLATCSEFDAMPDVVVKPGSLFQIKARGNRRLSCDDVKYALYLSPSASGPFKKIATLSGAQWKADAAVVQQLKSSGQTSVYSLLPTPPRAPVIATAQRVN